jgi:hypothetical protein
VAWDKKGRDRTTLCLLCCDGIDFRETELDGNSTVQIWRGPEFRSVFDARSIVVEELSTCDR